MLNLNHFQSGTAAVLALGLTATTMAPLVAPAPSFAQSTNFIDVSSNYWASEFIGELSQRGIIAGFPDGSFRPNAPVTRAQFAAMLRKANQDFNKPAIRGGNTFVDVASNYWANPAIQEAYQTGFLSGYPGNIFRPEQNIPREQVLVALSNGLNFSSSGSTSELVSFYRDGNQISNFARAPIAAATENRLVVNYPNVAFLNPTRNATRAEVAAFMYQALVATEQAPVISSQYIIDPNPAPVAFTIPAGTSIPVKYKKDKILLAQEETIPLTLTVDLNITTADEGKLLIPAGSEVVGELRATEKGAQFVAQRLLINGETLSFNATSEEITTTETIRKGSNPGSILKDAAVGTAAAAAISAVTGDRAIATEEILIGVSSGIALNIGKRLFGSSSVDLFVVEPETDLQLTIDSDLVISSR